MGLMHEAIESEKAAINAAMEAKRLAAEQKKQESREKYNLLFPDAVLEQRVLLSELGNIGLIGLVEEMIYPDEIAPLLTPDERKANSDALNERLRTLKPEDFHRAELSEEAKARKSALKNREWSASVLYPEQLADGSFDTSARIKIGHKGVDRYMFSDSRKSQEWIDVTYSPTRRLQILGAEQTLDMQIGGEIPDINAIAQGLAKAFIKPRLPEPLPRRSFDRNTPIG